MADTGFQIDGLDQLPLPVVSTDRLVVGRTNDLKRMDVANWRGGPAERTGVAFPQAADFPTWVNQDSAVVTDLADGFEIFHSNSNTGDSLMSRVRTIPGGSWDIRLGCIRGHNANRFQISGMVIRESGTNKIVTWGFAHRTGNGLFVNSWSNNTTFNATRFNGCPERRLKSWFRAVKNGTNIDFYASESPDYWGDVVFSQAITTNFTTAPNQWGAFINPNNTDSPAVTGRVHVFDWSE